MRRIEIEYDVIERHYKGDEGHTNPENYYDTVYVEAGEDEDAGKYFMGLANYDCISEYEISRELYEAFMRDFPTHNSDEPPAPMA